MAQTITTAARTEVIISTLHRARLISKLKMRAELQAQLERVQAEMMKNTNEIEQVRAEIGEKAFSIEGRRIARVEGTFKQLDKKLFVTLGGDLRLLEQATVEKPRKPHTRITMPGERDHDTDS